MPLRARDFLGSFHFLGNSVSCLKLLGYMMVYTKPRIILIVA